tara:strand:- start:614 stop:922 length:309 start_codon:yes stop_codon:yes gene_type:complete
MTPKQMHMEMENGLPSVGTAINDQPVSAAIETNFLCDTIGGSRKLAHNSIYVGSKFGYSFNMISRDNEDMYRSRWFNIIESDTIFVFVDEFSWYCTSNDIAE